MEICAVSCGLIDLTWCYFDLAGLGPDRDICRGLVFRALAGVVAAAVSAICALWPAMWIFVAFANVRRSCQSRIPLTQIAMAKREWQRKRPARRHEDRRIGPDRAPRRDAGDAVVLYGWHTVTAALKNPARRINRLLVTENALRRLADEDIAPAV